ncbi:MAG: tRNA lysidine(34) synthetase TilS, partial [Thermoguttaceae bacterium]|nr:tRNA lysidine(34) synthetase TilS [Thermoguttaceae bacterium]
MILAATVDEKPMDSFEKSILKAFPFDKWRAYKVCLAVSGGADSVALLRAFAAISARAGSHNIVVATVDHRSRGEESDADVAFVRDLAAARGIEFVLKTVDPAELTAEARRLGSWENAAREARYRLLFEAAKTVGARYLATAHNRDDNLETILFRLFRGSGFDGLRGVPGERPLDDALELVRPMLHISRVEILAYLARLAQSYRTDSSNASPKYARNRIRR